MATRFEYRRLITFAETDLAGIMHFANFFRLMEEAEHALFRSLGFSVHPTGGERIGWPRVHASCDFHRPLRFEDVACVEVLVEAVRSKAVIWHHRVWRDTAGEGAREAGDDQRVLCATGRVTAVCVSFDAEGGRMRACQLPEPVASALVPAPADLLDDRHPPGTGASAASR